jgi:hypothetical protein
LRFGATFGGSGLRFGATFGDSGLRYGGTFGNSGLRYGGTFDNSGLRFGGAFDGCRLPRPDRGRSDEAGNRLGELGAALLPIADAVERQAQALLAFPGDRVVEADSLDEAAVASIARIRNHDIEKRALLGASTGKSNDDHDAIRLDRKRGGLYDGKRTPGKRRNAIPWANREEWPAMRSPG